MHTGVFFFREAGFNNLHDWSSSTYVELDPRRSEELPGFEILQSCDFETNSDGKIAL